MLNCQPGGYPVFENHIQQCCRKMFRMGEGVPGAVKSIVCWCSCDKSGLDCAPKNYTTVQITTNLDEYPNLDYIESPGLPNSYLYYNFFKDIFTKH